MTGTSNTTFLDNYMAFLEKLGPGAKLDLISKLTHSLKSEINPRKNRFDEAFGAWEGKESAEDITKNIRDSRNINREIDSSFFHIAV